MDNNDFPIDASEEQIIDISKQDPGTVYRSVQGHIAIDGKLLSLQEAELLHSIKQHHKAARIILKLSRFLQWFNPFNWLKRKLPKK